jgi:hypothetical protein
MASAFNLWWWLNSAFWPEGLRRHFEQSGEWPRYAAALRARTAQRIDSGERDHLAFYVLQSREFTTRQPIPPLPGTPANLVRARIGDFLTSPPRNEKMAWLKRLPSAANASLLWDACRHAIAETDPSREGFYLQRGLSTDSELEAGFIVDLALATAKQLARQAAHNAPARRILIVGPGLDWAPRTGFADRPPQSHQPLAVLDSLLRHGWSKPRDLSVTALDVNPRVIHFIQRMATNWRIDTRIDDPDLTAYGETLGRQIGNRSGNNIQLDAWVKPAIQARLGNIVLAPPPDRFDIAVATNMLLYFDPLECELALHWLRQQANPGAWLIHNDTRSEVESAARQTGWTPRFARRVPLRGGLEDSFSILRA